MASGPRHHQPACQGGSLQIETVSQVPGQVSDAVAQVIEQGEGPAQKKQLAEP